MHRCLGTRLLTQFAIGLVLMGTPVAARADHVVWFNPAGAKYSGASAVVAGSTPEALRIQHSGGAQPQPGTVTIPLSLPANGVIDSIYVCYRTTMNEFPTRITGISLRTMALPTNMVTLLSDVATHSSLPGECLGLNVADVTPFGAPDISISVTVEILSFIEFGAIGIKVAGPLVGVNESPGPSAPSLALAPGWPNPFSPRTRIEYLVAEPGRVRLQIVDTAGRVVRSLVDRELTPGPYTAWWDGRDDGGRALPAGVYFSRVANDRESRAGRLVLLR